MNDETDQYPTEEADNIVSKSEIKRELLELQALGERLLTLKPDAWEKFNFSPVMMAALEESTRIKSLNARRRHIRRLGKLLREEEIDLVRELFENKDQRHLQEINRFHVLERWRDRLLEEGDSALNELLDEYPNAQRQPVRQLIRLAKKEQLQGKSPAASRKLFKYLREIDGV